MSSTLPSIAVQLFAIATFAACAAPASAQFTSGNVVVLQVGDGTATLSGASAPLFLKAYNTTTANQTTPVSSVTVPVTGAARLTNSGSASSEGQITLSQDGSRIVIAGYDASPGVTSVAGTTSSVSPRAIDTVGVPGIPGRADTTQTQFSGNNIRCAARGSTENYWAVGAANGVYYMGNTAPPATVNTSTAANNRVIIAANGKLYYTTSTGTPRLLRINAQPATTATVDTLIQLGASASPYGFAINSSESVAYVADERTSSGGGIQKWTLSGSTWSLIYTLSVGSGIGARSVIADWTGSTPVLYAITTASGGGLVRIVDSGMNAVPFTLASGSSNSVFRSVAFAPCANPSLSTSVTNYTCAAGGVISLSVTSGSTPTAYSWTGPAGFSATTQNISNLQPGTYTVTTRNPAGCQVTTNAIVANSATAVTATITAAGSTTRCQGDSLLLTANAGAGYKYQWRRNGNPLNVSDTFQTYKAGAGGTYSVVVSSGINCAAVSAGVTVTVNPLPIVTVTPSGPTTFCTGGSVSLCASPSTGYAFQWRLNSVNIVGATTSCVTTGASGTYKVLVISPVGCVDTSSAVVVTSGPPPAAPITPSGTIAFCKGSCIVLHTNKAPGLTYTWKKNGVVLTGSGFTDSTLTVTTSGLYKVIVSVGPGCADSSGLDTVIVNQPSVNVVQHLTPDSICAGDTIKLRTTSLAGNSYQWSVSGTMSSTSSDSNFVLPTSATKATVDSFLIYAITTTSAGCKDTSSMVHVIASPLPTPPIVNNAGILSTATYNAYQWYLNGMPISGATAPTYIATVNGKYAVAVVNDAGCEGFSPETTVSGVGIRSVLNSRGVYLLPNPVQDMLRIQAPFEVRLVIRDATGRTVLNIGGQPQVSLLELPDGVFSATVYTISGQLLGSQALTKAAQ